MDRKELSVRVAKIALDLATANWTAAAQGGMELGADLADDLSTSITRVAKRAARAATDALDDWATREGVSSEDFKNGVDLAIAAASVSPEELAELVARHFPNLRNLSDAMLQRENLEASASVVAARVLDVVLAALVDEPDFRDRLDRAILYGSYREILSAKHDAERRQNRAAEQMVFETRRGLSRHTEARVESLLSRHRDREFDASLLNWLRGQVRPADQWRIEVTHHLDDLAAIAERAGRIDTATRLRAVPLDGSFDAVRGALRRSARLISAVDESLDDEGERSAARRAAGWLTEQTRTPRYRTSVLLAGRWGSGKSRALGELASSLAEGAGAGAPNVVVLRLLPESGRSFSDILLGEARQALRRSVGTVDELTAALHASGAVGIVIVDDLDRLVPVRFDLENVIQVIADSTGTDRLRWVFAVDSWRLDRVLSPAARWQEFSSAHSVRSADGTLAGWLDLDRQTVNSHVGMRIADRELGDDVAAGTLAREELLDFPLHAWLHVDVEQGRGVAADSFEESYWSTVFQGLVENSAELDTCDRIRGTLEELFASSGGQSLSHTDVLERASGAAVAGDAGWAPLDRDDVRSALEVFGEARLLAFPRGGRIEMRSPALWAVGIGRNLAHSLGAKFAPLTATATVQSFLDRCEPDLAEAVLMHFVGSLPWNSPYSDRCRKLVGRLIRSQGTDRAGVWAAALLLGDDVRRSVVQAMPEGAAAPIETAGPESEERGRTAHEVYLLLRLCLESDEPGWGFAERTAMLRHAYAVIGDNGLQSLMHAFIARRLQPENVAIASDRLLLLRLAEGLERALSARELARAWMRLTVVAVGTSHALAEVSEYFRATSLDYAKDVPLGLDQGQRDDRAPFPTHLADAMAAAVAADLDPVVAYASLERAGWLDRRAWPTRFGFALRSTCHVALGHQFMSDPAGVIELLRMLLGGGVSEQESMLFILRHTAGTSGQRGIRLNPDLVGLLFSLARSNTLSPRIRDEWLAPMLDANRR